MPLPSPNKKNVLSYDAAENWESQTEKKVWRKWFWKASYKKCIHLTFIFIHSNTIIKGIRRPCWLAISHGAIKWYTWNETQNTLISKIIILNTTSSSKIINEKACSRWNSYLLLEENAIFITTIGLYRTW